MFELVHVSHNLAADDTVFAKPHPTRWKLSQLPAHGLDIVVCWEMPELPIHVSHSSAADDGLDIVVCWKMPELLLTDSYF